MPETEAQALINRFMEEVINRRNFAVMDELVAADFVEHVPFPGQGPGRDGRRHVLENFHRAFPDLHWKADEQIASGEKVVTRFTWTGTHRAEFLGIPATGKNVSVWGIVIDVVHNGKFVESRILMDVMGLMAQLQA